VLPEELRRLPEKLARVLSLLVGLVQHDWLRGADALAAIAVAGRAGPAP
jgi:hypothetical protein